MVAEGVDISAAAAEAEALKAKGNGLLQAGSLDAALGCYAQALGLLGRRPPNAANDPHAVLRLSVNLNAALACLRLERWEQAEGHASEAIRANPRSTKALYRRGLARSNIAGLKDDATRDFKQALSIEPMGEAADLVNKALARLSDQEAEEAKFVPPKSAKSVLKGKYQEESALRQRLGDGRITWLDWLAAEKQRGEQLAQAKGWRYRVMEAGKSGRPAPIALSIAGQAAGSLEDAGAGDAAVRRALAERLEDLAAVAPLALPDCHGLPGATPDAPCGHPAASEDDVLFVSAGPWFFDGKSSTDIPFDSACNPSETFSVELRAVCHGGLGSQALLTSRDWVKDGPGQRSGYAFNVEPEGRWSFWVGAGERWMKLLGPSVSMGTWAHLRGVVDTTAQEVRFYVDQKLVQTLQGGRPGNSSGRWPPQGIGFIPNSRQPLRLGAGQTEAQPRFHFTGDVKDVAVYARDISDEDLPPPRAGRGRVPSSGSAGACEAQRGRDRGMAPGQSCEEACSQLPALLSEPRLRGDRSSFASQWCTAVIPATGAQGGTSGTGWWPGSGVGSLQSAVQAHDAFRATCLDFLELGSAAASAVGSDQKCDSSGEVHGLFLAVDLQARAQSKKEGEEIELSYDRNVDPRSKLFWAVVLQCGGYYRLLFEVEGISSLADTLRRQTLLRPHSSGWVTQKDVSLWLSSLEMLAFSTDPDEVERAVNTVFLFGYWAEKGYISPDVQLADFQPHTRHGYPRARAAIVECMPQETLKTAICDLTSAAQKQQ